MYWSILIFFMIMGCGQLEQQSPDAIVDPGILGAWQGVQSVKTTDSERFSQVRLELASDSSFALFDLDTNESAKGYFDQFEQLSAMSFSFESSSMTSLSLNSRLVSFEYLLQGNELKLNSLRISYVLKRDLGDQKAPSSQNSLAQDWLCRQQDAASEMLWNLRIDSSGSFSLKSKLEPVVLMTGSAVWQDGEPLRGRWVVEQSKPVEFWRGFDAQANEDKSKLSLQPWLEEEAVAASLVCERSI